MRPAGLVLAFVLAGCGGDTPDLRRVEGGLEPGDVPAFLGTLARHCEALDAKKAEDLEKEILALEGSTTLNVRRTVRRDGRLVSVLELNVDRTGSGRYGISIRANRDVADAVEPLLRP